MIPRDCVLALLPLKFGDGVVIGLVGLVEAEESERIEGMLIDWVQNARILRDIIFVSINECEKWAGQIREAIEYLHDKGLVWGDAKAANVLVGEDGNAVLIDFGGEYTNGWVEEVNRDTARGDLQGLERIVAFMEAKYRLCGLIGLKAICNVFRPLIMLSDG